MEVVNYANECSRKVLKADNTGMECANDHKLKW